MKNEHTQMIREANARLSKTLSLLDDQAAAAPSLLPDWNRAMLITHLVGNARGTLRVLEAAGEGSVGEKYPGGRQGREAEIRAGEKSSAEELLQAFEGSAEILSDQIEALPDEAWRSAGTTLGAPTTVGDQVLSRFRELEVHHADLDMGYGPRDWPHGFVIEEIDKALTELPKRLPEEIAVVMAAADSGHHWVVGSGEPTQLSGSSWEILWWIIGRGHEVGGKPAPELGAWT